MFFLAGGDVRVWCGASVSRSGSGFPTTLRNEIFYSDRPFATAVGFICSRAVDCNVVLLRSWF